MLLLGACAALFAAPASWRPAPVRAATPTEQQRLHKILGYRNYWVHRLKTAQKQEQALQNQLENTRTKLGSQQARLQNEQARAAAQQARLSATISGDEQQVAAIHTQLQSTRAQYKTVHAQAEILLRHLRRLRARIHRELGHVRTAIVQLYDLSQVPPLEQILEARSLTDLLQEQSFISEIGARDTAILERARAQRRAVYRIAVKYIDKMRELRALERQKKVQLKLMVVATKREDLLLIRAQRLTARRQANIKQEEAAVAALGAQERQQIQETASSAQNDQTMALQSQSAAEKVAEIIAAQTGQMPNIGGPHDLLLWPLTGIITQPFGPSPYKFEPPLTYGGVFYPHFHTGLDIAGPFDSPIRSAAAGRVIYAGLFVPGHRNLAYGLCVIIMHNQHLSTLYAHMDDGMGLAVQVGQDVSAGQVIGYEGMTGNTTGPHLHFEVRVDGNFENPLNYLPKQQ